jgi:hypothetical protein
MGCRLSACKNGSKVFVLLTLPRVVEFDWGLAKERTMRLLEQSELGCVAGGEHNTRPGVLIELAGTRPNAQSTRALAAAATPVHPDNKPS